MRLVQIQIGNFLISHHFKFIKQQQKAIYNLEHLLSQKQNKI